jgi:hypothetical protein
MKEKNIVGRDRFSAGAARMSIVRHDEAHYRKS